MTQGSPDIPPLTTHVAKRGRHLHCSAASHGVNCATSPLTLRDVAPSSKDDTPRFWDTKQPKLMHLEMENKREEPLCHSTTTVRTCQHKCPNTCRGLQAMGARSHLDLASPHHVWEHILSGLESIMWQADRRPTHHLCGTRHPGSLSSRPSQARYDRLDLAKEKSPRPADTQTLDPSMHRYPEPSAPPPHAASHLGSPEATTIPCPWGVCHALT